MTAPADRTSAIIPDWLFNLAALGWRVIAIAALVVVLWMLAELLWTVTASIAIAIVIAAAFAPFALRLRARGRSRTAAAAIVWAVALAILGGAMLLLSFMLLPYVAAIVVSVTDGVAALQARLAELNLPPVIGQDVQATADGLRATVAGAAGDIVASGAGVITVMILAAFLVFFFLQDGDRAWVWIFQAVFNLVTGNIVSPLVYGKTVHLHPAVVLVAIPAGAAVGGILGMFLVVPFIGIIAAVWRTVLAVIGMPRQTADPAAPAVSAAEAAANPASPQSTTPMPQPAEGG